MQWQVAAPITGLLVLWAHFGNKLTPTGILAAIATAAIAAYHPWNLSFTLLCVFFLIGNIVTKVGIVYSYSGPIHVLTSSDQAWI